jgi:ADP-heptose:LPS heptosyltransferase
MICGDALKHLSSTGQKTLVLKNQGGVNSQYVHPLWIGGRSLVDKFLPTKGYGIYNVIVRGNGLMPYWHHLEADKGILNYDYRVSPGEIAFTNEEWFFGDKHSGRIILEPHVKNTFTVNKQWGWDRWQKLAHLLEAGGLRATQLMPKALNPHYHDIPMLRGVEVMVTDTFRKAAAVLAFARGAVLPEGGLHHACGSVGTPAVVIFGGFTDPKVMGYDHHVNLFTGEFGCGNRKACPHCLEAMSKITPEEVFERLKGILREPYPRPAIQAPVC